MPVEDLGHYSGSLGIKHLMLGSDAKIISSITSKGYKQTISLKLKNVFLPRYEAK